MKIQDKKAVLIYHMKNGVCKFVYKNQTFSI